MNRLAIVAFVVCVTLFSIALYDYFGVPVRDVQAAGDKLLLVPEFAEAAEIAQEFDFLRDGLHSVTVSMWSDAPLTVEIAFELRRRKEGLDSPAEPVRSVVRTITQPAGRAWHTFEFPPLTDSKGRLFVSAWRLRRVIAVSSAAPVAFGLMASADDVFRAGRLFVGGRERWGDLIFFAQASPARRLDRMIEAADRILPANAPHGMALAMIAAVYCVLLVVVAVMAVRRYREHSRSDDAHGVPGSRFPASLGGLVLVVGAPALWLGVLTARERVAVDLLRDLDKATLESPAGLHGPFGVLEESINGYRPTAIFAHPPSRMTWPISVPVGHPVLKTAVALRPPVWEQLSDGVTFTIAVQEGTTTTAVYSKFLNPREHLEDRAWVDVDIDLSGYAGRFVKVEFETSPGPAGDASYDWAMWAHPRILAAR